MEVQKKSGALPLNIGYEQATTRSQVRPNQPLLHSLLITKFVARKRVGIEYDPLVLEVVVEVDQHLVV